MSDELIAHYRKLASVPFVAGSAADILSRAVLQLCDSLEAAQSELAEARTALRNIELGATDAEEK